MIAPAPKSPRFAKAKMMRIHPTNPPSFLSFLSLLSLNFHAFLPPRFLAPQTYLASALCAHTRKIDSAHITPVAFLPPQAPRMLYLSFATPIDPSPFLPTPSFCKLLVFLALIYFSQIQSRLEKIYKVARIKSYSSLRGLCIASPKN